ncbi:hypothetical protein [Parasphingorhabdus sp.]|uniref:hypothetical protein n=1 Tax=Parasphingorhabdus sp. TaxID=2709688 RepID=UPI003BAE32D6
MFEITGEEIQRLDDVELRTLVARLALAELRARNLPVAGVTAGGDQNAPDGGLDVRIEVSGSTFAGDFIPRTPLGIQVKKSDMGSAAITKEMKPNGVLRPVLGDLADSGGGYIIVSAKGSVADEPLRNRRKAIMKAVAGHPSANKLLTDFYDRERMATWVNQYPGVAAWVRARVGRPLAGWQSLGDWSGVRVGGDGKYISDDAACLVDTRSKDQNILPIVEGINCIRRALSKPRQCVRLIGMSGLGKTRLVQALFESDVGSEALDPSFAVYADYSEAPQPTAQQLALQLVETGQRAILIVDNCNPQTHSYLSNICGSSKSKISLITVEYDVRDDEPERTEVFRLQAASESTIGQWLKVNFGYVSQVDRDRIVEFSGGNFRVAGVLADTVKSGGTLGNLKDRELFGRIFQQRNDHSEDLLSAAEALALVYSFDGTDTSETSELALLAPIAGVETTKLYAFVAQLKRRSVVQSRGRWRALLPHAIANRLAAQALERIPADQLDSFCASIPVRMQKSVSRRLGYLHHNDEAKQAVARWLHPDGPLENLLLGDSHSLQLLHNIAPVAPEAVLRRIEEEVNGAEGYNLLNPKSPSRWQLTMILKSLCYDATLFDRAAILLGKFLSAEVPNENHNSARGSFEELFHLHLSGTQALPDQRRKLIRTLYRSSNAGTIRCGHSALRALLRSGGFSSSSNFDFGAHPRDFGWHPPKHSDIWNWYRDAIDLAVELSTDLGTRPEIRRIVADRLSGILGIEACLNAIEAAATEFLNDGEWIDGWLAVRGTIQFHEKNWKPEVKDRVLALEELLRPSDPLNVARAYILESRGSGFDVLDDNNNSDGKKDYTAAHERLAQKAEAIGREFGSKKELLAQFLTEALCSEYAPRAFSFGVGLAKSGEPLAETWQTLRTSLTSLPVEQRNSTILGGFLHKLYETDAPLGSDILDKMLVDSEMAPHFVYLQAQAGLSRESIARLRKAISSGHVKADNFYFLASGLLSCAPQDALAELLDELGDLERGTAAALEIFHMATYCLKKDGLEVVSSLIDVGHQLLLRTDYKNSSGVGEYRVQQAMKECYSGPAGEQGARELCQHLKMKIATHEVYAFELDHVFDVIFELQPLVALDEFFREGRLEDDDPIYGSNGLGRRSPLEKVESTVLWSWANQNPQLRYPLLSRSLNIFVADDFDGDNGLSPMFLEALENAPDRAHFLNSNAIRMLPGGWSGDLSLILDRRSEYLGVLSDHVDQDVRMWASKQIANLKRWADQEREREIAHEESFE